MSTSKAPHLMRCKSQMREGKRYKPRAPSQCFFFCRLFCFCSTSNFCSPGSLTENNMAVEHRLPLFLDLPSPALLGMLHFVQHVGTRVWPGQNIVSIGKRLLVLKTQNKKINKTWLTWKGMKHLFNSPVLVSYTWETLPNLTVKSQPDVQMIIHTFKSSRLDYCNSLFTCLNKACANILL